MPSTTTIRVTDNLGAFLFETAAFLDIGPAPGLHYVLSCGLVGALTVTLSPEFNSKLLKDGRIHVMRSVNGGPPKREGESCYLIRKWQYADDFTVVTALHANHIMWRRISAYAADTANSSMSGQVDDNLSNTWDANFDDPGASGTRAWDTSSHTSNSTQADISAYVSKAPFAGVTPTSQKFFPWLNIGDVMREFCDASTLAGTYMTAEVVCPTESTLEWRTYADQRGVDRRFSTGSGLLFTEARGNLANAMLTVDATNEVTVAIAGGAGRDLLDDTPDYGLSNRVSYDATRIAESPLNRIEAFVDSGTATDLAMILGDADAAVRAGRPVINATAELQETDQCIRGVHFDYGDVVTVEVQGVRYDMRLDVLDVTIQGGVEMTTVGFFYDDR